MHGLISDIGIAVSVATIIGYLFYKLKQPIILAYFVAGIIIGPEIGPKQITDPGNIEIISEIGLILLLFIIGLEINPHHFLSHVKKLLIPGIGQFPLGIAISVPILLFIGYGFKTSNFNALYTAIAISLSSTAIAVKLLYDKHELDSLSGKATIGILIFQDIWAIFFLAFQPNLADPKIVDIIYALVKVCFLLVFGILFSKYVLKRIFRSVSDSPEMIVSLGFGWCIIYSGAANFIGLSMEMGALIAGVSVASFPYSHHVNAKILPLRDFFLTLFFISLGMKIPYPEKNLLINSLYLVGLMIFTRLLSLYPLMRISGSGQRTSFVTFLDLAHISEFSLVIAAIGLKMGHIDQNLMSVLLYAMAISSITASYLVKYNHQIFEIAHKIYSKSKFPHFRNVEKQEAHSTNLNKKIILLGYHRGSRAILHTIAQLDPELLNEILVIDFNTEIKEELDFFGVRLLVGDITSMDTFSYAGVKKSKLIVSTLPDMLIKGTTNLKLVEMIRELSGDIFIITHADFVNQVPKLLAAGANEVILPYSLAGEYLGNFISKHIKKKSNDDF